MRFDAASVNYGKVYAGLAKSEKQTCIIMGHARYVLADVVDAMFADDL